MLKIQNSRYLFIGLFFMLISIVAISTWVVNIANRFDTVLHNSQPYYADLLNATDSNSDLNISTTPILDGTHSRTIRWANNGGWQYVCYFSRTIAQIDSIRSQITARDMCNELGGTFNDVDCTYTQTNAFWIGPMCHIAISCSVVCSNIPDGKDNSQNDQPNSDGNSNVVPLGGDSSTPTNN